MRRILGIGTGLWALSLPGVALAAGISDVHVQGSYETGGVIVTLSGASGNESATLEVKGPGDADFKPAHPFVRYDEENLASSLFSLAPGSDYQVRVTLTDPDGVSGENPVSATLSTLAVPALPTPKRTRYVGPGGQDAASAGDSETNPWATLSYALGQAQPGDEIRLLPGTYAPGSLSDVQATADAPIVIRAHDAANRPVIDAGGGATALELYQVSHVVLDGLEITGAGGDADGVGLKLSARVC
ncbi:MAG: hypothetical protein KC776_37540 [Myxococcales bacterium]|nr:hypothetical protein [Myxococcales bacterium]MCB9581553.1 hypothetical protein [Polyangiaceae bacterium]